MRKTKLRLRALAGVAAAAILAGCGGGGGGSSTLPGACDATTFTPNYAVVPNLRHWPGFPLRVFLGPTNQATRDLTLRGFDQWVAATGNRVNYILVNDAAVADVTVSFDLNTGGSQLGLTTITYRGSTLEHAEIQFFFVPSGQPNAARINQITAAHEFGHALGISIHSPVDSDLMAAVTDGTNTAITARDLNTLLAAYCNNFPQRLTAAEKKSIQNNEPLETFTIGTNKK
jgi:hypothetical protein